MDVVVDDHILLRVLLGDEPPELREDGGRVVTTGLWYHRLCRAVTVPAVVGALSRSLGGIAPEAGAAALRAVTSLPETVALVSLRELAWPMGLLRGEGVRLNLMSLEALAAAEHLDADLCLATADDNPPLRKAAEMRGRAIRPSWPLATAMDENLPGVRPKLGSSWCRKPVHQTDAGACSAPRTVHFEDAFQRR